MTTHPDDEAVTRAVEGSALVKALERIGASAASAAASSRVFAAARARRGEIAASPGRMLLIAVAVHLSLAAIGTRPPGWYWLILPLGCAVVAVVMMGSRRSLFRD
jgi:hypothetical protein